MTSLELREKRAPLVKRTRELADKGTAEGKEFNAEDQANWDQLHKDYEDLTVQITRAEQLEQMEADQKAPIENEDAAGIGRDDYNGRDARKAERDAGDVGNPPQKRDKPTEEDRNLCLQGWMRCQQHIDPDEEHVEAAKRCKMNLRRSEFVMDLRSDYDRVKAEHRALSAITGSAGAATIPEGFIPSLEMALLTFGGMRLVSELRRTTEGNALPWPTTNDTSNTGAIIGENTTVTEQDVTFGALVLQAYKYTSKLIKVPSELLEDSAFNLAQVLGAMLGERLARIQNTHFTTGDGAAKPKGVLTAATLGVTAAGSTAFTYDEVINLFHSVDPSYRTEGSWMFHDNILLALKKLKDGEGNYLWRSGDISKGIPDTIENKPFTVNQDMTSTITAEDKIMLFGRFKSYKIREVNQIRMRRLVERYADADQEGFVAFMRFDGNLLDAGTNPIKHLQLSA